MLSVLTGLQVGGKNSADPVQVIILLLKKMSEQGLHCLVYSVYVSNSIFKFYMDSKGIECLNNVFNGTK